MKLTTQTAGQFKEVYLNGVWVVATNLKAELSDVNWEEATTKIGSLNTIAAIAYHVNYYIAGLTKVLTGGPLDIRDKYSFDMPPIESQADWDKLLNQIWNDGERFADLLAEMPDEKLMEGFIDEKYGNYYKNIHATIQHCYYHLGQIVLLKKLIRTT